MEVPIFKFSLPAVFWSQETLGRVTKLDRLEQIIRPRIQGWHRWSSRAINQCAVNCTNVHSSFRHAASV